jgi:long-chain fatty acid transport protein
MSGQRLSARKSVLLALIILAGAQTPVRAQFGALFSGAGPINGSMAGVGMATAIDSLGSLFWNPATLSGLPQSEVAFGLELIFPQASLASTLPAGAIGGLLPTTTLAGSDRSANSVFPLPAIGLAYQSEDKRWTFGLGVFAIGGFGVNYPASTTDPVLTPQPPNGFGLGNLYTLFQVLEMAPQISYQLTDHLAVGFGPAVDLALLQVDPGVFVPPDNASGNGFPTYPAATHIQAKWGFGLEAGAYYTLDNGFRLGASVKSPRWFERFVYQSATQFGDPRTLYFDLDLPLVASAGVAYSGFERWLFGVDTHYIDFTNADLFRQSGFNSTGALQGVGWRSIWTIAAGAQYQLCESVSLRLGYSWNQNPIDSNRTFYNLGSPLFIQNTVTAGASYQLTDCFSLSLAYLHVFQNTNTGAIILPTGVIPGSSVSSSASGDVVILGGTVRFGGGRKMAPSQAMAQDPVDGVN